MASSVTIMQRITIVFESIPAKKIGPLNSWNDYFLTNYEETCSIGVVQRG